MAKFKVGDKVRVKSLEWYQCYRDDDNEKLSFVSKMSEFCGKIVTIENIVHSSYYIVKENNTKLKYLWEDYMFEDEDKDKIKKNEIMEYKDNVKLFKTIADELCALYERKNNAYGNSFGDTYQKLGLISAATRISDKYNRLCNLVKNPNIDNLGESIEDTLQDLAAYAIMTLIELRKMKEVNDDDCPF